jgi:hypothetical protein
MVRRFKVNQADSTGPQREATTRPADRGGSRLFRALAACSMAIVFGCCAIGMMMLCWTLPAAGRWMQVGAWMGGWLPHGTVWRPLGPWSETGPPYILDSAGRERWFSGPALLAGVGVVVVHLGLHAGFGRTSFRSPREFAKDLGVMLALVGAASIVWMIAWGATYGRLSIQQRPMPVALGGACISMMWLGAGVLYALWLSRGTADPSRDVCLACGYPVPSACAACPECGCTTSQAASTHARRRRVRKCGRLAALYAGSWLLLAPYSMTVVARVIPYSVLDAIASKLPTSW